MKLTPTLVLLLAALPSHAQTPVELRVDNETAPPGGVVQIKLGLTDPHPISTGQVSFSFSSDTFDSIFGVNLYSGAGDVAGAAVVQGPNLTARFNSPLENLGVDRDYPILTTVIGIKPTAPIGTIRTLQPDLTSVLKALIGADIPYTLKPGTLTVGGSLYISNIVPGGGLIPAGSIVKVIGGGFTPNTQVVFNQLLLTSVQYKSANEIWVTTGAAGEMTSRRISVREGNTQVFYYSYLRTTPLGSSTRALLNRTEPIFTATRSVSATVPGSPAAGTGSYAGLALQNDNLSPVTVSMDLVSSTGALIGHWVETLPSAARYVRDLAELFGTTPPTGSKAVITSSSSIKVLGLAADDATSVVNPVIPTAGASAQLAALPAQISLTAPQGAAAATQTLNVVGIGAQLNFQASATPSWLSISSPSGTTPATLTVSANPAGLIPGTYNGTVVLSATGVPSYQVSVTFTVTAPATLTASPASLSFSANAGGGAPAAQQSTITGGGSLAVSIIGGTWLNASASANIVTVSVSPNGLAAGTYTGTVRVQSGAAETGISVTFTVSGSQLATGRFVPLTPCRVADTRAAAGPFGGPTMPAQGTRTFAIPAAGCGFVANALAYSLNITVVPQGPLAFLTAWPTGQPRPLVSTLNAFDGAVTSNAAIVPAGTSGSIDVFVTDATDVIIDINGYFLPGGAANGNNFYPVTPCRIADTRNANGTFGGPFMAAGAIRDFPVPAGACGIPSLPGAAYSVNVTVVPRGPLAFLTLWPTGQSRPNVSTLNSFNGTIKANAAIVPAGTGGAISVYVTDATDVILDINGYFAAGPGGLSFYPLTPCRLADTRNANGPYGGPVLGATATRDFAFPAGACGVPASAQAVSTNVTVVPASGLAFLTAWPTGSSRPLVSTLNSFEGKILANAALIPLGAGGSASVFVTDQTHVILDINGYFAP